MIFILVPGLYLHDFKVVVNLSIIPSVSLFHQFGSLLTSGNSSFFFCLSYTITSSTIYFLFSRNNSYLSFLFLFLLSGSLIIGFSEVTSGCSYLFREWSLHLHFKWFFGDLSSGRNLPVKEFCYLRTVNLTAAVYISFHFLLLLAYAAV